MKRLITTSTVALLAAMAAGSVSASTVGLTWTSTLSQVTGGLPGVLGETIRTIILVDNGGTTVAGQVWGPGDFLSYRIEGDSGWWAESGVIEFGSGSFATDAAGTVTSAGSGWGGGYFSSAPVMTSWLGPATGGWWSNGANEVFCTNTPFDCAWASNVGTNQDPAYWTASLVDTAVIPLPASLPLLLGGFGLLFGVARRRRNAA